VFGFLPYSSQTVQGSFSEYLVVRSEEIAAAPKNLSAPGVASSATVGLTAIQALGESSTLEGRKVLVNGASGGVGSIAVQYAKSAGAVVHATCNGENREFVASLGASKTFDYRKTDVSKLSGPYDIFFDAAAKTTPAKAARVLQADGRYITTLPSIAFLTGVARFWLSKRRATFVVVKPRGVDLALLADLIESEAVQIEVEKTFAFEQVPDALEYQDSQSVRGKVAVSNRS
ncbi:MAG: NAD(P)-dependent alcohol dehydrogenase, partial [Myxococcales bacterium]|nr:NAD(P)-dependent alcohol dehydrogenase [Myxococcales bacterium]